MAIPMRNTAGKSKSIPKPKASPKKIVSASIPEKTKCQLCDKKFPLVEGKLVGNPKKFACPNCVSLIRAWRGPRPTQCELCPKVYDLREYGLRFLPGTSKGACPECFDRHKRFMDGVGDKVAKPSWFVLSCEPGRENAVRKRILKAAKTRGVKDKIIRFFSPMHHVEALVPTLGEIVAQNEGLRNPNDARAEVKEKLWELERDNPGVVYRERIFEDQKTGKWGWKVRVDLCEETLAVVKRRKYKGYMLVHMVYDKDTADLFKRQGVCWGLLLQDIVPVGLNVKVSWLKSRAAWRWTVHNLKGVELARGHHVGGTAPNKGAIGRDAAREAGRTKAESLKVEQDYPSGLDSEEAAIEVLNDKLMKEIDKDKSGVKKAALSTVPYSVGDKVTIKHGPWTGTVARVAVIDREKGNPEASVLVTANVAGGSMVTLRFKHHQLTKGDK